MFVEFIKQVMENKKLYLIISEKFKKNLFDWKALYPEETIAIQDSEFNEKELSLDSLTITKSNKESFMYKIEAKCSKVFLCGIKIIYILKFNENLELYDDVFYTESKKS